MMGSSPSGLTTCGDSAAKPLGTGWITTKLLLGTLRKQTVEHMELCHLGKRYINSTTTKVSSEGVAKLDKPPHFYGAFI